MQEEREEQWENNLLYPREEEVLLELYSRSESNLFLCFSSAVRYN